MSNVGRKKVCIYSPLKNIFLLQDSDKYNKLSRTLSWLLRHAAVKEGLTLSSNGFIPVSEILNHKNLRGKFSAEDVEFVVKTDNKQRFTLRKNNNLLEIRANQGHSLQVSFMT